LKADKALLQGELDTAKKAFAAYEANVKSIDGDEKQEVKGDTYSALSEGGSFTGEWYGTRAFAYEEGPGHLYQLYYLTDAGEAGSAACMHMLAPDGTKVPTLSETFIQGACGNREGRWKGILRAHVVW
jgi:hypothetical protein